MKKQTLENVNQTENTGNPFETKSSVTGTDLAEQNHIIAPSPVQHKVKSLLFKSGFSELNRVPKRKEEEAVTGQGKMLFREKLLATEEPVKHWSNRLKSGNSIKPLFRRVQRYLYFANNL